jgi:lysophospholipase L1-like esterase
VRPGAVRVGTVPRVTGPSFERYVAIGDSTTEGLEDPYPDGSGYRGWADRLAEALAVTSPGLTYANLAIRGRKVPQMRAEQLAPALALEPDLASVLGGVNDILRRHVDLKAIAGDMEAMVSALRERGATVIMMTYPDPTAVISVAAERIRARVAAFNDSLRAIAARNGAVIADLDRDGVAHPTLWSEDRLHANAGGHERMAAAAAEALGVDWHDADWRSPLPQIPPRRLPARLAGDVAWMGRHLAPWVMRRVRGRSSGDGRVPKRPELGPI